MIIKIINASSSAKSRNIMISGSKEMASGGKLTLLQNGNPGAVNTFADAVNVSPKEKSIIIKNNQATLDLQPYSFNILRVPFK
ncbi:hypothetical protein [Pedobacter sp. NJ-S-72]